MTEKEEIDIQKEYIKKVRDINKNKRLKYYILTMGCSLNENDSEKLCGMLEEMNYSKTESFEEANFIVFNTCCIRENAEDKLFGKLGEVKKAKKENNAIIAIGGCMMQEEHILEKLNKSYPYVDIIFGTHTLHKLPENVYKILEGTNKKIEDVLDIDGKIYEDLPIKRVDNIKAQVTIMYGYNVVDGIKSFKEKARKEIEKLTAMNVVELEVVAKNIYIPQEDSKGDK